MIDEVANPMTRESEMREFSLQKGLSSALNEDERRLNKLGYTQEMKRIFNSFTNFGLTASMISILLGIIPLYTFELQSGGPVVMVWSWITVGFFSFFIVSSLAEICSAFPTMGALYYWAYRLGGPIWGPFASWIAGWCNLLGQIAGVASGGYAGAQIMAEIIALTSPTVVTPSGLLGLYAVMLIVAGIVNSFSERLLTFLCYISVTWQIVGTFVIVIGMLIGSNSYATAAFVFTDYNNQTGFASAAYVALVGSLAAASVFTGYDTGAHVAEETNDSFNAAPLAMLYSILNAYILGLILIIGMNFCITDLSSITNNDDDDGNGSGQAYTLLWQQTVGNSVTLLYLVITLVAIECSNCANLTSAARMIYAFARDGALPYSSFFYHVDPTLGSPVRAIVLTLVISFILALPSLGNSAVLSTLFSLTATGLYASYIIPIILRITISRDTFQPAEFNLGNYSIVFGVISILWGLFMVIVLCLPSSSPVAASTLNYSSVALGSVLSYALVTWFLSARHWFKVVTTLEPHILNQPDRVSDINITIADIRASVDRKTDFDALGRKKNKKQEKLMKNEGKDDTLHNMKDYTDCSLDTQSQAISARGKGITYVTRYSSHKKEKGIGTGIIER